VVGIGLVGCGQWGLNYLRNFTQLSGTEVVSVWDCDQEAVKAALKVDSGISSAKSMADLLNNPSVQGVIIATPPDSHYHLAKACLEAEKHVLVEKPFTLSLNHARELGRMAEEKGLVLLVGHLMEYHPAVLKIKRYIACGLLGQLWYLDSHRAGKGKIRPDVSVLWDLAVHDIALACFLTGSVPVEVTARGESYVQGGLPEVVFLTLSFEDGVLAHIQASWLAPARRRSMMVVGGEKAVWLDELNLEQPLAVYDSDGRIVHPQVDKTQPLYNMCVHFGKCIEGKAKPLTGSKEAGRVLAVLEAAQRSLNAKGRPVQVSGGEYEGIIY